MAADPYFEVRAEVESSLLTASTLHASYLRILQTLPPSSHTSSEELSHALVELKSTLSSLFADVEELEESVRVLEQDGVAGRFGVARDEVARRREWVEKVKTQVAKMQREAREPGTAAPVSSARGTPGVGSPSASRKGGYPPPYREDEMERGEANDADEFELEHQTVSPSSVRMYADVDPCLADAPGATGLDPRPDLWRRLGPQGPGRSHGPRALRPDHVRLIARARRPRDVDPEPTACSRRWTRTWTGPSRGSARRPGRWTGSSNRTEVRLAPCSAAPSSGC